MTLKRPFDASTLPALIMKIMKGSFEPVEGIYSHELRKLLLSMLHLDHNQRPTAAQIMCHPVMVKVIFKLYVDIGSIPCNKCPEAKQIFSKPDSSKQSYSHIKSASSDFQSYGAVPKSKRCTSVLLFENTYSHASVLSSPPKTVVKNVSLGSEDKIGITGTGLLISWRIRPVISINSDMKSSTDQMPSYIPHVIDERVAINIISVVCGSSFSICLSDNGVVFAFGKASSGCLGLACDRDINQPRIVESLFNHDIKSIACGPKHVLALSEENDVFVWGHGSSGCLGLGDIGFQLLPQLVQIKWKEKPEKIFCGADCSFIITKDSALLACGSNRHNKLAMDSSEGRQVDETRFFTKIRSEPLQDARVVSVSSGKSHTVILNEAGELYSMGSNRFGQLGWGKPGLDYCMPQIIEKLKDIKVSQVSCGNSFTLVVTHGKELFCCGKGPSSLICKEESNSCDMKIPKYLERKCVHCVSCYGENCIILAEDK